MGKLKDKMPIVDAFVDQLRETFGREEIDRAIVEGLRDGHFYARENGHELGKFVSSSWEGDHATYTGITLDRMTRDNGSKFVIHVKRRGRGNGTDQAG
jgi:hypothetical protein